VIRGETWFWVGGHYSEMAKTGDGTSNFGHSGLIRHSDFGFRVSAQRPLYPRPIQSSVPIMKFGRIKRQHGGFREACGRVERAREVVGARSAATRSYRAAAVGSNSCIPGAVCAARPRPASSQIRLADGSGSPQAQREICFASRNPGAIKNRECVSAPLTSEASNVR
jgi:hypothetical protein